MCAGINKSTTLTEETAALQQCNNGVVDALQRQRPDFFEEEFRERRHLCCNHRVEIYTFCTAKMRRDVREMKTLRIIRIGCLPAFADWNRTRINCQQVSQIEFHALLLRHHVSGRRGSDEAVAPNRNTEIVKSR